MALTVAMLSTTLDRPLDGKCHDCRYKNIFNSSLVWTLFLCVFFPVGVSFLYIRALFKWL